MASRQDRTVLAIDIGGTKVAAGIVNSNGRIIAESRGPMSARGSARDGLESVFRAVDELLKKYADAKPKRVGISVAGWVDPLRGILTGATNIPCWRNFPLPRMIKKRYGIPALLSNDANAAALAESTWGAGKGHRSIFYVTLGTGIGTGIVLDARIHAGRTGAAGEGGHVTIDFHGLECGCGKRGCIEAYASGTGIARRARERLKSPPQNSSKLFALAGGEIDKVTAEMVGKAAKEGDALAREILEETADLLGIWMGTVVDLIEPEIFVFGGGVGHLMMKYRRRLLQQLEKWAIAPRRDEIDIVEARFGAESALAGAAALCFEKADTPKAPRRSNSRNNLRNFSR